MVSYSTALLIRRRSRVVWSIIIITLLAASVSSWPIFSGDMNGYWNPASPPYDYIRVNEILRNRNNNSYHHSIWLPSIGDVRAIWSRQSGASSISAPTGIFGIRTSGSPSYYIHDFYFFDYHTVLNGTFGISPFSIYLNNLADIYGLLNIKYLIITYDRYWSPIFQKGGITNERLKEISEYISKLTWAQSIYSGEYLSTFELQNDAREFSIRETIISSGGLRIIGSIYDVINYDTTFPAVLFLEDGSKKFNPYNHTSKNNIHTPQRI